MPHSEPKSSAAGSDGRPSGVWLPLVTPLLNGEVDLASLERLVDYYVEKGVAGLIALGTTGESPTIEEDEADAVIACVREVARGRVPVLAGVGSSSTRKVIKSLERTAAFGVDGFLVVCPYYNRPGQDGLRLHFQQVAEATELPILIYNIPYRTGVNLSNDVLLELAEIPNIVGVKDCCGTMAQSVDLLLRRPSGFRVLTGEDAMFFAMVVEGADGGVLASAHLRTEHFLAVAQSLAGNDHGAARQLWRENCLPVALLLFKEPNPGPVKYVLWREGLISSPECRLPMTPVTAGMQCQLDELVDAVPLLQEPGAYREAR